MIVIGTITYNQQKYTKMKNIFFLIQTRVFSCINFLTELQLLLDFQASYTEQFSLKLGPTFSEANPIC